MASNDFIAFASGGGANVATQAAYAADTFQTTGQPSGATRTLTSLMNNKIWRQAAWGTAALGQMIVNYANQNAQDNGNTTQFQNSLTTAIQNIGVASALVKPLGRLTLSTGVPVPNTDVSGATSVFYTGFLGDLIPIWNGSAWQNFILNADLVLNLTAGIAGIGQLYDVFAFNNVGVATLGLGPAWASASSRGTGPATTQISRIGNSFWTNAQTITLNNGATVYPNLPLNTCVYLGTIQIDGTAGQCSCLVSATQNARWGVFNAYNRQRVTLQIQETTASWTNNSATVRPLNNNIGNVAIITMGLAEEFIRANITYSVNGPSAGAAVGSNGANTGIGWGSTTAFTDNIGTISGASLNIATVPIGLADSIQPPFLGSLRATWLEQVNGTSVVVVKIGSIAKISYFA